MATAIYETGFIGPTPWPVHACEPEERGLWSLLVIIYRVERLWGLLRQAECLEKDFGEKSQLYPGRVLTDSEKGELRQLLVGRQDQKYAHGFLEQLCELEMPEKFSLVTYFEDRLVHQAGYLTSEACVELRSLRESVESELASRLFLYVPQEKAGNYQNAGVLSENARERFPLAYGELLEASNCYATERNPACVFHSMCALEEPLHFLAKKLKVELPKSIDLATWGELHRQITKKVDALRQTRLTEKRNRQLQFYSEAGIQFGYFKDAWRNFVCHGRAIYDEKQAASVLNHVRSFIEHLTVEG